MTATIPAEPKNASVIVTGAARGLGAAIATRFLTDGYRVFGIDLDETALRELADRHHRLDFHPVGGDASSESLLAEVGAAAVDGAHRLHAFVANAGIGMVGDSLSYSVADWNRTVEVNVTAAFLGARVAVARMSGPGSIVMMSSVSGHTGFGGRAAYSMTKAGIHGLVRSLAVEWAPRGIRVNAVSPGIIRTDLLDRIIAQGTASEERYLRRIPMGRLGADTEIADAVHFLASERASYITGVVLPVDGGWVADGLPAPGGDRP